MIYKKSGKIIFILVLLNISEIYCLTNLTNNIQDAKTSEVIVHSGRVIGRILETIDDKKLYSAFKGIRYGQIPSRFSPPIDVTPWNGVYEALYHGDECMQYRNNVIIGSENCLFLNVYTPLTDFKFDDKINPKKAVMVWIHGGRFEKGSGNSEKYGPDFILSKDVILVTLNYRLSAFGFLNLQHPKIPGNAGLKDQALALKWVKRNIAKFGGDPDNITIFGQSAGAVSVDLHLLSEMSRGLFTRSIAMSGSVFSPWAFSHKPIEKAKRYAHKLKTVKTDDIEELVKLFLDISPDNLIKTHRASTIYHRELEFNPSIENEVYSGISPFIDNCFDRYFIRKDFFQGEHILGYTSQEVNFGINAISNTISDILFDNNIDLKQKYLIKFGTKPVYYYVFGYDRFKGIKSTGIKHTGDLQYLFYKGKHYEQFTDKEKQMKDHYTTMFTNFAKYGNPSIKDTGNGTSILWTPSNNYGNYLEINATGTLSMKSGRPVNKNENNEFSFEDKNLCSKYKPSWMKVVGALFRTNKSRN